jgi:hypothetical protein
MSLNETEFPQKLFSQEPVTVRKINCYPKWNNRKIITICFFLFQLNLAPAQTLISIHQMDSLFPGKWKGTSICHIKDSPCNNENVVYYVTIITSGHYSLVANKIVAGKEEDMGTLIFQYQDKDGSVISKNPKNQSEWTFIYTNSLLHGVLINNNQIYRFVQVSKIQ